jgi:hypothetical protein
MGIVSFNDFPIYEGDNSFAHCGLRGTIFDLPHTMTDLNSRVRIRPEWIMKEKPSPIQRVCQELVDQVNRIGEGATMVDYPGFSHCCRNR